MKNFNQIMKRFLTLTGWRQFFRVLNKKEKISFFIFLSLFLFSFIFLLANFYFKNTKIIPAEGGIYIEGVVGSPRFINPIYSVVSDIDSSLTELIFSGLMKYENGKIVPDLAENFQILEDGKVYEFYLKKNLFWSDGKILTADDVIFTIETIQNPDVKSPLRTAWLGVEIEKISDNSLRFKLKNPSATFLENSTLKIIPKHIWENISPQNFSLSIQNLKPVGSGPYKLKNLSQDKEGKITSLELVRNEKYFGKKPYLKKIIFKFFEKEEDLIKAAENGQINGFSLTQLRNFSNFNLYSFSLPRYFAIFFNQKSKIFSEKEVRQALNYGVNKEEILNEVLSGYGEIVHSPILPNLYGFEENQKTYQFEIEKGKELLEKAGFQDIDGDGLREKIIKKEPTFQFKSDLQFGSQGIEVTELQKCLSKDPEIYPEGEISGFFGQKTKSAVIRFQEKYREEILKPQGIERGTGLVKGKTRKKLNEICFEKKEEKIALKFSLVTVSQPILVKTAEILKKQWRQLGADVEIKTFDIQTLEREIIRKRDFEAILFGEVLGFLPDPFPFWHSSQKGETGLNLANYENKKVDKLLEEIRSTLDDLKRKEKLEEFQEIIIDDAPALFLYNPDYLYFISKEIKGIKEGIIADPSKRFFEIENWYIKTKRVWK